MSCEVAAEEADRALAEAEDHGDRALVAMQAEETYAEWRAVWWVVSVRE